MRQLFSFFDKKVTIAVSIKNIILVSIVMYLGWEFYWYTKVGLAFVKWHTHLMPFILILFLSLLILQLSYKKAPSKSIGNFYLLFASIIFSLFMIEAVLVVSGLKKTQLEKQAGYYRSPYATQENSYYHIWSPGLPHYLTGEGYSYIRQTNMEGFADIQWRIPKKPKEKRILALGDSFTEGDGASFDSSFVAFLRNDFSASGDSITIMNAGVCGSDPFNNYIVFKDRLQAYKPDIIIQSLGSGDMDADIMTRGGMERFQKDGTTKYRPAPWWEPFYAVSYISRIFFSLAGYDELLHKLKYHAIELHGLGGEMKFHSSINVLSVLSSWFW